MTDPIPTRHSLRPTPSWLIFGLLVVEGLLWLSERFQWFPKGGAVLLAMATVPAIILLILLWFAVCLLFRWPFQFSLRSLVVLVVAVALSFSWMGVEIQAAKRQKEEAASIQDLQGWVDYDFGEVKAGQRNSGGKEPSWLRSLLGVDFFHDIRPPIPRS